MLIIQNSYECDYRNEAFISFYFDMNIYMYSNKL